MTPASIVDGTKALPTLSTVVATVNRPRVSRTRQPLLPLHTLTQASSIPQFGRPYTVSVVEIDKCSLCFDNQCINSYHPIYFILQFHHGFHHCLEYHGPRPLIHKNLAFQLAVVLKETLKQVDRILDIVCSTSLTDTVH